MLLLSITSPDRSTRRRIFMAGEIKIGDRDDSDLRLPGADARHARIVIKDARCILVDLRSSAGTYCNARRLVSPVVIRSIDVVTIAEHVLQIIDVAPRPLAGNHVAADPAEHALLEAIAAGDESSALIYADWLEGRGDLGRAEIVRRRGNSRHVSTPFLELLIEASDIAWRVRILRPPIEGCSHDRCPGDWGALRATPRDAIRSCATCVRDVRYCANVDEARRDAGGGVVIDPLALRWSGDLAPHTRGM